MADHIHYRSKVWGHPDNFMFFMKTQTFIHQMSCKINRKYSQDIDKVRNNCFRQIIIHLQQLQPCRPLAF